MWDEEGGLESDARRIQRVTLWDVEKLLMANKTMEEGHLDRKSNARRPHEYRYGVE
jgi:hypothetical protein